MAIPEDCVSDLDKSSAKLRRGHWRERDLQRAIAVAKRSGVTAYRVEIAPDGTISIVVGERDRKSSRTSLRMRRSVIH